MNFDLSDPKTQAYIGTAIRYLMVSSPFIVKSLSDDQISVLAGIVVSLVGLIWGIVQKKTTIDNSHAAITSVANQVAVAPENKDQIVAEAKAGKF